MVFLCSMLQLLVTANIVPSSLILVTLMMEVIHSTKMSVLTRAIRHNFPAEGILQTVTMLVRHSSICMSKLQTLLLIREGAPYQKTTNACR
jgi:hypothetical protein